MATVKRHSYGMVPVVIGPEGKITFLMLRAYKNWDFPKGGPEVGETPFQTAMREMGEETGLSAFELPWGMISADTDVYAGDKVATYYLVSVQKQDIVLPNSVGLGRPEHDEYRWVSEAEARVLLPKRLVGVFDWAVQTIQATMGR